MPERPIQRLDDAHHSLPPPPETFFSRVPALQRFEAVTRAESYVPVPSDHYVVVTDVVGSTEAVQAGQYRDVNYVGAASIAAVLNVADGAEVPFVFGGDGATLIVSPALLPKASDALAALRVHAADAFGLDLRAGVVPVHEIQAAGHRLAISRFSVSPNYAQAMFIGSGMAYAERLVKEPETRDRYEIEARESAAGGDPYRGLECRWEDVRSAAGETVTLLITAEGSAESERLDVYRDVIHTIEAIYGAGTEPHPIAPNRLRLSHNPRRFLAEVRLRYPHTKRWYQTYKLWALNLIGIALVRLGVETSETDWGTYPDLLRAATDYRKFDDTLRMVLAGTPSQRHRLETDLERRYQAGRLTYGIHVSDRAVLTCLVHERMGRQVHFVDGADGGYTMAAAALKRRARQMLQAAPSSAAV